MFPSSFKTWLLHSTAGIVLCATVGAADAHEVGGHQGASADPDQASEAPHLWDNLGSLSYPVTTKSADAQRYFDQGLRLAYAFNHAEARRAFHHAQTLDPSCALCYWGEALVLGPNVNAPMASEAVAPSLAAIARAKSAGEHATAKEQALIAALQARYSSHPEANRSALDQDYAQAMLAVARRFPEDGEIAVLAAEALMDTQPWDYWAAGEGGAKEPKGHTQDILGLLEQALARNPDHPGAIHLYIHMLEASDQPERAVAHAARLPALMPGAGHLVHMPSHIYYRIGRYQDSRELNEAAVTADEAFFSHVRDRGIYRGGYYPHNQHFVLVSAQMTGDGEAALAAADKLTGIVTDEAAATIPWVQPIKAAPYFAYAQFGSPEAILRLPDPGEKFPLVKAMWQYARGIGKVKAGDLHGAGAEAQAIEEIAKTADLSFLESGGVPGKAVVAIASHVLRGRIAEAGAEFDRAIAEYTAAIALEDQMPYMEPPFWYYPVRQSLGEALLQAGRTEEAIEAFKASLEQVPNNGWALRGLLRAQQQIGDAAGATATAAELAKAWPNTPEPSDG